MQIREELIQRKSNHNSSETRELERRDRKSEPGPYICKNEAQVCLNNPSPNPQHRTANETNKERQQRKQEHRNTKIPTIIVKRLFQH